MIRMSVIIPYFGELPSYMGVFLCGLKKMSFDILWVSDIEIADAPSNFKWIQMTFEELKDLICRKIATDVVIANPKRLCDFKPMYGKIFEDYLRDYEYWGFGDCDLVYGKQLNSVLKQVMGAGDYDIISLHEKYLSGCFCLLRNSPRVVSLYKEATNWREVAAYLGSNIVNFDECGGPWFDALLKGEMTIEECSVKNDSFSAVAFRSNLKIFHERLVDESDMKHGEIITLHDGHLHNGKKEIPIFHYIMAKNFGPFYIPCHEPSTIGNLWMNDVGCYYSLPAWRCRFFVRIVRIFVFKCRRLCDYFNWVADSMAETETATKISCKFAAKSVQRQSISHPVYFKYYTRMIRKG